MRFSTKLLIALLIFLGGVTLFLNLWTPPGVDEQAADDAPSTPLTEREMINRVRDTYNQLGRAGDAIRQGQQEAEARRDREAAAQDAPAPPATPPASGSGQ